MALKYDYLGLSLIKENISKFKNKLFYLECFTNNTRIPATRANKAIP